MASKAYTPQELYRTLAHVLDSIELSEIAISPYILPDIAGDHSPSSHIPSLRSSAHHETSSKTSSIRPFSLVEGDKLVLPQKSLYAVFGYAVKALACYSKAEIQTAVQQQPSHTIAKDAGNTAKRDQAWFREVDSLTKCILLQNPEHARALNLRKKLVLHDIEQRNAHNRSSEAVQMELDFCRLALGIASNAKMGTLWHHRRWLYKLKYSLQESNSGSVHDTARIRGYLAGKKLLRVNPVQLCASELQQELELVKMCGERYPRNYQAWAYRYWLVLGQLSSRSPIHFHSDRPYGRSLSGGSCILYSEYEAMECHLATHIGDHTAAMHMVGVLSLAGQIDDACLHVDLIQRSRAFAADFVRRYPHKETPWLLLRGVLSIQTAEEATAGQQGSNARSIYVQQAMLTAETLRNAGTTRQVGSHDECSKAHTGEDWEVQQTRAASRYAVRMLFYLSCLEGRVGSDGLGSDEARSILEQTDRKSVV